MKILVADDEPTFRQVLSSMLKRLDYDPILTPDGNEAWRILEAEDAPQLALLDWMMPGIDGVELCRRIREQKRERYIYVILLTSKSGSSDIVTAMEAGADDYLVKPPHPGELRVRVHAGRRIVDLQNQLFAAREQAAQHAADVEAINNGCQSALNLDPHRRAVDPP